MLQLSRFGDKWAWRESFSSQHLAGFSQSIAGASTGGKQSGVSIKQVLRREGRIEVPCGVEHHLDDSVDFSSWLRKARDIEPELAERVKRELRDDTA